MQNHKGLILCSDVPPCLRDPADKQTNKRIGETTSNFPVTAKMVKYIYFLNTNLKKNNPVSMKIYFTPRFF